MPLITPNKPVATDVSTNITLVTVGIVTRESSISNPMGKPATGRD